MSPLLYSQVNSKEKADSFLSFYMAPNKNSISPFDKAFFLSSSGNSYNFMELRGTLGALNTLISKTGDERLINQAIILIDNIINTAQVSKRIPRSKFKYKDDYLGWIATQTNNRNEGVQYQEVPLFESYLFLYITQFLYLLKENNWFEKSLNNRLWWHKALAFIETNEWEKWYERSYRVQHKYYRIFLRGRTHMGAHWAGIAMYLKEITSDWEVREQCIEVQAQYDLLLKRNLKPNPKFTSAYIWNSTYDNIAGTDAMKTKPSTVQDVSHGNHVINYIVSAFQLDDTCWSLGDIHKLCNTLKYVVYDKNTNSFNDKIDGTQNPSRPGWGNFIADGWIKLAAYDTAVAQLFKNFENNKLSRQYGQELQFRATIKSYDSSYSK